MKLPQVNDTFAFPVTLPSTGKEISMRPYLVGEEKLLLMANESTDYKEQAQAISQIVKNCTNGVVEPTTAPYFDIEFLLLQLRARSIGEIAKVIYVCKNQINVDTSTSVSKSPIECNNETPITININEVKVQNVPKDKDALKLVLSDDYDLILKYPTIFMINDMFISIASGKKVEVIDSLTDLFDKLVNKKTNEVFPFEEVEKADRVDFMNTLSPQQFDKISKFFEAIPTMKHEVKYTCSKCSFNHEVKLSGLGDFLEHWLSTKP